MEIIIKLTGIAKIYMTAIEKVLKEHKFKKYRHSSGAVAWSIENLCEYSDEWLEEKKGR